MRVSYCRFRRCMCISCSREEDNCEFLAARRKMIVSDCGEKDGCQSHIADLEDGCASPVAEGKMIVSLMLWRGRWM